VLYLPIWLRSNPLEPDQDNACAGKEETVLVLLSFPVFVNLADIFSLSDKTKTV
jgi:hypothetical protein